MTQQGKTEGGNAVMGRIMDRLRGVVDAETAGRMHTEWEAQERMGAAVDHLKQAADQLSEASNGYGRLDDLDLCGAIVKLSLDADALMLQVDAMRSAAGDVDHSRKGGWGNRK